MTDLGHQSTIIPCLERKDHIFAKLLSRISLVDLVGPKQKPAEWLLRQASIGLNLNWSLFLVSHVGSGPEVQRLVAGGKRAALPLVARGQLRVEGDLGQLEESGDRSGDGRFGVHGPNLVPSLSKLGCTHMPRLCRAQFGH